MLEFFRRPGRRLIPCPICRGRGQITIETQLVRCFGCQGKGTAYETSERTDADAD